MIVGYKYPIVIKIVIKLRWKFLEIVDFKRGKKKSKQLQFRGLILRNEFNGFI